MKLCVYAIMRDEITNVAAWAETTVDADERFVLDTGSTDMTESELMVHGITHQRAVFEPFRFDDARNCALALAPEADLYLRLDADERLDGDWREQLDAAYDPHVARYRYRVHNTEGIWTQITRDDLHRRAGFRWKYPTHEVLIGAGPIIDLPRFVVTHIPSGRRRHHETNYDVLYHAVVEYPGDHRMVFYLGRECWYIGRWEQARQWLSKFLEMTNGWAAERSEAYRILAAIDDFPERWLWHAVAEAPDRREPWVDLARFALRSYDPPRAALFFTEAERRSDEGIYTTDSSCWGPAFEELREEIAHSLSAASDAS